MIPDEAYFEATVRTFSPEHRERAAEVLPRVVHGIAAAHGLEADAQYTEEYPVTVNDQDETAFAASVVDRLFPERHTQWAQPLGGSEDFSFVLREVPGSFLGLGAAPPGADLASAEYNHSPRAVFDDGVLADGAALYAALAIARLERLQQP